MFPVLVSGLEKRFGPVAALRGVSLRVRTGEVVALLGPNGAGKTTLLRILATAVLPERGEALVAGHDVTREPLAVRQKVGVALGDERSWYWRLTGRRNLKFFAALYGIRGREADARIAEVLRRVGLDEVSDRRFDGYSSGMRARLSLARSLINHPRVLLLDEPTRNLDPIASSEFREVLAKLARKRGVSVLFATHDLHEAAELADRVLGLSAGLVAFERGSGTTAVELEAAIVETAR